jgi:hypothetical protein
LISAATHERQFGAAWKVAHSGMRLAKAINKLVQVQQLVGSPRVSRPSGAASILKSWCPKHEELWPVRIQLVKLLGFEGYDDGNEASITVEWDLFACKMALAGNFRPKAEI